ncbi:hypothetical protein ACQ10I_15960, partial [Enterococcus faecalis]
MAASTEPADCSGMWWPSRLLEVEPLADVVPAMRKVGCAGWRVVRELPAWQALGPCGREVVAYLALLPTLTDDQWQIAARSAARDAARSA